MSKSSSRRQTALDPSTMSESTRRLNAHLFASTPPDPDAPRTFFDLTQCAHATGATGLPKTPTLRQSARSPEEKLNKLERAYLQHLRAAPAPAGFWHSILIQPFKLPLANGHGYTPDFITVLQSAADPAHLVLIAHEVKGPWFPSRNRAALKVAAHSFPWITFNLVTASNGDFKRSRLAPEISAHWQTTRVLP